MPFFPAATPTNGHSSRKYNTTSFTKDLTGFSVSGATGSVVEGTDVDLRYATTLTLFAFGSGEAASGGTVTFEYVFDNAAIVTIQDSTFDGNVGGAIALSGHCPVVRLGDNNVFQGNTPFSISQTTNEQEQDTCPGMLGGKGTSLVSLVLFNLVSLVVLMFCFSFLLEFSPPMSSWELS